MYLTSSLMPARDASYLMGFGTIAVGLSKIHGAWKWYRYGELFTNKDNALGLAAGHLADIALPGNIFLRLPAVPFYAGSLLLDLFSEEDQLAQSWSDLKESIFSTIPINPRINWTANLSQKGLGSTYTITCWSFTLRCAAQKTYYIGLNILSLSFHSFKLVMRIMDVIEIFTLDVDQLKSIADRSIREGGVHIPKCLNALAKNKHLFLERLENKTVFSSGIETVGGDPEKIKEYVRNLFSRLEGGLEVYDKVNTAVGNGTAAILKKGLYDIANMVLDESTVNSFYNPDLDASNPFNKIGPESNEFTGVLSFSHIKKNKQELTKEPKVIEVVIPSPTKLPKLKSTPPINLSQISKEEATCSPLFNSPKKKKGTTTSRPTIPVAVAS